MKVYSVEMTKVKEGITAKINLFPCCKFFGGKEDRHPPEIQIRRKDLPFFFPDEKITKTSDEHPSYSSKRLLDLKKRKVSLGSLDEQEKANTFTVKEVGIFKLKDGDDQYLITRPTKTSNSHILVQWKVESSGCKAAKIFAESGTQILMSYSWLTTSVSNGSGRMIDTPYQYVTGEVAVTVAILTPGQKLFAVYGDHDNTAEKLTLTYSRQNGIAVTNPDGDEAIHLAEMEELPEGIKF